MESYDDQELSMPTYVCIGLVLTISATLIFVASVPQLKVTAMNFFLLAGAAGIAVFCLSPFWMGFSSWLVYGKANRARRRE